jgi:hypothetical protein
MVKVDEFGGRADFPAKMTEQPVGAKARLVESNNGVDAFPWARCLLSSDWRGAAPSMAKST